MWQGAEWQKGAVQPTPARFERTRRMRYTAEIAACLIRCPRSRPPKVVCVWLSIVGRALSRLRIARAAGGMVGYIGGCHEGASWAWRSLSSRTCHDEEVRMGVARSGVAKRPNSERHRHDSNVTRRMRSEIAACLIRCPRSRPQPTLVCVCGCRVEHSGEGLEQAGDRTGGWRGGGLHWRLPRRRVLGLAVALFTDMS